MSKMFAAALAVATLAAATAATAQPTKFDARTFFSERMTSGN